MQVLSVTDNATDGAEPELEVTAIDMPERLAAQVVAEVVRVVAPMIENPILFQSAFMSALQEMNEDAS